MAGVFIAQVWVLLGGPAQNRSMLLFFLLLEKFLETVMHHYESVASQFNSFYFSNEEKLDDNSSFGFYKFSQILNVNSNEKDILNAIMKTDTGNGD